MFSSWILQALPAVQPLKQRSKVQTKKTSRKASVSDQNSSKAHIFLLGESEVGLAKEIVDEMGLGWEKTQVRDSEKEWIHFQGEQGPVWVLRPRDVVGTTHGGLLAESQYAKCRDLLGTVVASLKFLNVAEVHLHFMGTTDEMELGAFVGLEMATYSFKDTEKTFKSLAAAQIYYHKEEDFDETLIQKAVLRARSVNIARHLVNTPPNLKTPQLLAQTVKSLKWSKQTKVEIWNEDRLRKEKCNLILAVGQGSPAAPCLVKISYRPREKSSKPLIAFVGKGITFDTGGLDIKPSAAMRLMKKDMGGAASVVGLAHWVDQSQYDGAIDFYLAIAENAVDGNSMRPGDVYTSRSGLRVEIDNTDAEGRLVLADALDVAATAKQSPEVIVDLATLTGACRVALGVELAGLFTNDDDLAAELSRAGQRSGDMNWRLPLMERYFAPYTSAFADFKNAGESFGGAITAALFLQRFIKGKKWVHLDMYGWGDKPVGPLHFAGGNGQSVQALIDWLENR
jgi:leucyl aminopeptidase